MIMSWSLLLFFLYSYNYFRILVLFFFSFFFLLCLLFFVYFNKSIFFYQTVYQFYKFNLLNISYIVGLDGISISLVFYVHFFYFFVILYIFIYVINFHYILLCYCYLYDIVKCFSFFRPFYVLYFFWRYYNTYVFFNWVWGSRSRKIYAAINFLYILC